MLRYSKYIAAFLTFVFLSFPVEGVVKKGKKVKKNPYVIMDCREKAGVFSIFHDILALLKYYDKGLYSGIEVDFRNHGLFYSEEHGNNWWTYHCEPIVFGKKVEKKTVSAIGDPPFAKPYESEFHTSRVEAKRLIDKYIKFKPHINETIDDFVEKNFSGYYVFGIHYRGTNKVHEAPRISYEKVLIETNKVMREYKDRKVKIFVASDEQDFIDYMKRIFSDKVCFYEEAVRSEDGEPIHLNIENDPYKLAESAIIDCLLLSKTDYLFRTSSNLSLWSTYFSPDLPVIELTKRQRRK